MKFHLRAVRVHRLVAAGIGFALTAAATTLAPVPANAATTYPNEVTAYQYFVGKGLTDYQAAGIVGNLQQESFPAIEPTANNGGLGRGIAQWSITDANHPGGRWDTAANDNATWYAAQQHEDVLSLKLQLEFIWYELTTFSNYGLSQLRVATDVDGAAAAFSEYFEKCGTTCDNSTRDAYAEQVLADLGATPPPPAASNVPVVTGKNSAGNEEVFALSNGAVTHSWWQGASWSGWQSLGGSGFTSLIEGRNASNQPELFAVTSTGTVMHAWWGGASWSAWFSLGGSNIKSLALGTSSTGGEELFATTTTGTILHNWWGTTTWSGWFSLAGTGYSHLIVGTNSAGQQELFALTGGAVTHSWRASNGTWSAWASLGGTNLTTLTLGTSTTGGQELFATTTTGTVLHNWWGTTTWSGWFSLGGTNLTTLTRGTNSAGQQELFATTTTGTVQHTWRASNGAWTAWSTLGGTNLTTLAWNTNSNNAEELFATTTTGTIMHTWWGGASWSAWQSLGTP